MKTRCFVIVALSVFAFFCNAKSISNSDNNIAENNDYNQLSKSLIERYNKLRQVKRMNKIIQDTTLDNICSKLISNNLYRNIDKTFKEDSVRHLLFESGITDYQYEIMETTDNDTTVIFNSFLLEDNSSNIRLGYRKIANKHVLIKTKSFLHFEYWNVAGHSEIIDGFSNVTKASVTIDSAICHFSTSNPGKYYYQFCNHIPLSNEKINDVKKYEAETIKSKENQNMYDLIIKSADINKYLIISNIENAIISVTK